MNLVQKLPIGLGLACIMFMSSCSKEDVQTPEPQVESVKEHSNAKVSALPWVATTKGYGGINTLPNFWERVTGVTVGGVANYPAGTSTFQVLWGNNSFPWLNSFPTIPGQPWNSFITVTSSTDYKWETSKMANVQTKIKFLKPGYTYKLEYYVASARPKSDASAAYVGKCLITLSAKGVNQFFDTSMLPYSQNTWVKKTIEFTANDSEMTIKLGATSQKNGQRAYAHFFIGQDAVWQK